MTSERLVTRAASPRPSTVDEEARTVELIIASEADLGDGVILSCRTVPQYGPAPVPVLLSHQNEVGAMAGRIREVRVENRQVIGVAEFVDAPAADAGWQLARSGCAVSVGAAIDPDHLQPQARGPDLALVWRLREASLVPVGLDPQALTRSHPLSTSTPMQDLQTTAPQAPDEADDQPRNPFELAVRRAAGGLLPEHEIDDILLQRFPNKTAAVVEVIRRHRLTVEATNPVHAGHPARTALFDTGSREDGPGSPLAQAIERCVRGEGAGERPLVEVLRSHGFEGRTAGDVLRSALSGNRPENWLKRTFSTGDAKELLLGAGDRRLQERYAAAENGILQIARTRPLADFREAGVVDAGLVGKALLGQVAGMPRMMQEEHFDTSSLKVKIEGAFGVAVADHRVICRVKPA